MLFMKVVEFIFTSNFIQQLEAKFIVIFLK